MTKTLIQYLDECLPLLTNSSIAVGVSGGADSMALTLMLKDWCQTNDLHLTALTVDHQLRPDSSIEARHVHESLQNHGIFHKILRWDHEPIQGALQEQARDARYKLLFNYCQDHTIHNLFLAHHMYDQWETFFMRLSHGSGPKGLAGMSKVVSREGIQIFRPFLKVPPEFLKNYLKERQQIWIEDPSNQMETYERIRWRKQRSNFEMLALTPEMITKTCDKFHEADQALDWCLDQWIQSNVVFNDHLKYAKLSLDFMRLQDYLLRNAALKVASFVRGRTLTSVCVRHNMWAFCKKIKITPFKNFTFMGCYWMQYKDHFYAVREWDQCPTAYIQQPELIYDHRFSLHHLPVGAKITSVKKQYWPKVKHCINETSLPYQVFLSLPILIHNGSKTLFFKTSAASGCTLFNTCTI